MVASSSILLFSCYVINVGIIVTLLRVESCMMSWWLAQVGHGWDYTYYLDCLSYAMIVLK